MPRRTMAAVLIAGAAASGAERELPPEIPEEELLDVAVHVPQPRQPTDPEDRIAFEEIMEVEASRVAFELVEALQSSGTWGAVRIVPESDRGSITISGRILLESGSPSALQLRVVDAGGGVWLYKTYRSGGSPSHGSLIDRLIADIEARRSRLTKNSIRRLHSVSRLRFASRLSRNAFGPYLEISTYGLRDVAKLPARNDPMMERIERIRDRDEMLIDLLDEHYRSFHHATEKLWGEWSTARRRGRWDDARHFALARRDELARLLEELDAAVERLKAARAARHAEWRRLLNEIHALSTGA